jgi:integrase
MRQDLREASPLFCWVCRSRYFAMFSGGRFDDDAPVVKVNAAHTATVNRCGVSHFRLYDLRHTSATRSAQAGVDLV